MIDVGHRKCPKCNRVPSYNFKGQKKALYCNKHKKKRMINVISKRCPKCDRIPSYNVQGEKKALYCVKHKKGMTDIVSKKCPTCGFIHPIILNVKKHYIVLFIKRKE
jgi:uncharacterized protein (UPF0212 family)